MRILHVAEALDGGVLSLVRTYSSWQNEHGDEVMVLGSIAHELDVDFRPWALRRGRPWTYPMAYLQLRRLVARTRPDVVHLHSFFAGIVGRFPGAVPSAAVVYQPHSWVFAMSSSRLFTLVAVAVERAALRRTHRLVTNCRDEADEGEVRGVTAPGSPVGLPLDTAGVSPRPDGAARGSNGRIRVVCLGRLCRQKAQDRLVAAWESAPPPGAELVLVGGGETQWLAERAPREWGVSIKAVGHQEHPLDWLRSSHIFALSSRYEGQSVAVAEALACGLPVVMFDVNGAREAVVDGPQPSAGVVVAQGDAADLIREVRRRVEDAALRARESAQARARAVARNSVRPVMERLDREYDYAIAARRREGPR